MNVSRFETMSDEEIVRLIHENDDDALSYVINKYRNFVKVRSRRYFLMGADREDIVQEGMIGLFKAIRDYKPGRQASFKGFAELCITRQIITAVKAATRQKHAPLNSYVSLNKPLYEEEHEFTLLDVLGREKDMNPEEIMINREQYNAIEARIEAALSGLEKKVLSCYLQGKSYQEISAILGRHPKSIDNALQRIKRKVERVLAENAGIA